MAFTIILTQAGDFQLDSAMAGFAGDFILIIDAIGDHAVTEVVTGMVIVGGTAMVLVRVTEPAIERVKEVLIEMFTVTDQAV